MSNLPPSSPPPLPRSRPPQPAQADPPVLEPVVLAPAGAAEGPPQPASPLARGIFEIREAVRVVKVGRTFDITDPPTGQVVLRCVEQVGAGMKPLRALLVGEGLTPFTARIETPDGRCLGSFSRGWNKSLLFSKTVLRDGSGGEIGSIRSEYHRNRKQGISVSTLENLDVYDAAENVVLHVQADFVLWNFTFLAGGVAVARLAKRWSGLAKEYFTSADNYGLQIFDNLGPADPRRRLIVCTALAIDFLLKPGGGGLILR